MTTPAAKKRPFNPSLRDMHVFAWSWISVGEWCALARYLNQLDEKFLADFGIGRAEAECAMRLALRRRKEEIAGRTLRQITAGMRLDGSLKPLIAFARKQKESKP